VSTVLEPIRLDLKLTDAGVGFLTGVPLGLFYVSFGIPMSWLADRKKPAEYSGCVPDPLVGFHRTVRTVEKLIGNSWRAALASASAKRAERRRQTPYRGPLSGGSAPHGARRVRARSADRRLLGADMAGAVAHAYGWRAAFLALGIPGVIMGTVIYLTIRNRRADAWMPWRHRRAAAVGVPAIPVAPKGCISCGHGSGVCALWGWGLVWFTPTFLMRTYNLNVGEAVRSPDIFTW